MDIRIRRVKGVCIADCSGRLVLGGGEVHLRRYFKTLLEDGERRILINLTGLDYMDSAGVGELVACSKRALENAAVMKILLPSGGTVRRIFTVTGLDRAFELFHDESTAVSSLRG